MLEALVQAAAWFTPEQYLWWTRVQCLAWTAADAVIVWSLLRLANAARQMAGRPPHVFAYVWLGVSLLFAPLVAVTESGTMIFLLELLITVPHFLLILFVLAANYRVFADLGRRLTT